MKVRDVVDSLESYGDDLEVRVGWAGWIGSKNPRAVTDLLTNDAAHVLAVDYVEPASLGSQPFVLLSIGEGPTA